MRLASANEINEKAAVAKTELAEREALVHQSLQSQINDLKVQLAAKSRALDTADAAREAAERKFVAVDAKRNGVEEKLNELSISHSKMIHQHDQATRDANDTIATKDGQLKDAIDRESKLNNEIADARHQIELLVFHRSTDLLSVSTSNL
jgi:chromosome segregation ATPase